MNITDEAIREICSQNIYKRGIEYLKKGRIHIKTREETGITAIADGESVYSVRIDFHNDKISNALCTCAYCQTMGTACKHIVATLKKRQSELLDKNIVGDKNDDLAQYLCSQFADNCFLKERLNMKFILSINSTDDRKCSYGIELMCGFDEPIKVTRIDEFLNCYQNGLDYKISKHTAINSSRYSLGENEEKIMNILVEAYQNRVSDTGYTPRISRAYIACESAKRILPYLLKCDCEYYYNSIQLKDYRVIEDNPDILVDVNATDDEISINISQSGTALFPDGSWYLYDDCFFHTQKDWREWFMPIYNALTSESRTQIDFKNTARIDFATYVYPKIRNKQGVVTAGVDSILINEKPQFSVYLDMDKKIVTAVITVKYGSIDIRLPANNQNGEKIVIRDILKEERIISFFDKFSYADGVYSLSESSQIYEFITRTINEISELATVYTSESFDKLLNKKNINLKVDVKYNKSIDLLDVGFETELSYDEIYGILNSVRMKEKFHRMKDGSFITIDEDALKKFRVFDALNFSEKDVRASNKILSKYYALYLQALNSEGVITANDSFNELIEEIKSIKPDIPEYLQNVLRDYQIKGVNWLCQLSKLGFGGILADDMGLGKTLEVIAFVMSEKKTKPALVVAPSALTYNWLNEINKFAPFAVVKLVDGAKEDRERTLSQIDGADFVITSYPLIRRDISLYSELSFSYMFIDESQYIKNSDTMSAKAVKKINAERKFALSGTPVENNLSELWSVFDFVMKGYLNTKREFSKVYDRIKTSDDGGEELEELRKKIKPFVLRRLKADVLNELPEKIENTIYCDLVPEQKKLYKAFLSAAKDEVTELINTRDGGMKILTILLRLRQICCHPSLFDMNYKKESGKLEYLLELIDLALSQGRRILVFSQFTSMLDIIRAEIKKREIDCFFIDGKTPSSLRTQMADRFNNGEKNLFLVSLKAGGTGLNLTGADMVIHYDPWWNPAVMSQATDRAYRIGQTKSVLVIKLAARGTIEEQILKLQEAKQNLADSIIRKNDKTISGLSREEILSLFE